MIAQQVGSKATRDALFLSSFAPEELPRIVIAGAATSMFAVVAASRAFARFGPARVVPFAFAASAALYVGEWALQPLFPRHIAIIVYLHTAIFGALVISGFWSVVNERFDPHTAKRVIARIGGGATFGGVLGGVLAERIGAWSEASVMLALLAGLNAVAAVTVRGIGEGSREPAPDDGETALEVLRRTPYLRHLAAFVLLTAVSAGLLDYAFKAGAARHYQGESAALLSFFALFHTATAVLAFATQASLTKPALSRLGVAGTVAALPALVLMTASAAAAAPRLITLVVARGAEMMLANSLFRSGYELLYTPVAPARKRPTKALIDVAGHRLGDALGSVLVLAVLALAPSASIAVVVGLAAAVALITLVLARRLHHGYVGALEESLRVGTPDGAEDVVMQRLTLQTLSTLALDRETLFERVRAHRAWNASHPAYDLLQNADAKAPRTVDAPLGDRVHVKARALRSGEADEIRPVLRADELDLRLVPHVIALLARRDVYHDAIAALRRVATRSVPVLAAALLDADQPFAIRRRLPRVLEVCDSQEAADALAGGLDDARFEVRYRSALALARIVARAPDVAPPFERVHEVVARELEAGRQVWDSRRLLDEEEEDAPLVGRAIRDRVHRSVEHVFTVLSLAYEQEPLRLALVALSGNERALRGTALEYLETILPDSIREALFPMLDARVELRTTRTRDEIREELVRSMQSVDGRALHAAVAEQCERE